VVKKLLQIDFISFLDSEKQSTLDFFNNGSMKNSFKLVLKINIEVTKQHQDQRRWIMFNFQFTFPRRVHFTIIMMNVGLCPCNYIPLYLRITWYTHEYMYRKPLVGTNMRACHAYWYISAIELSTANAEEWFVRDDCSFPNSIERKNSGGIKIRLWKILNRI